MNWDQFISNRTVCLCASLCACVNTITFQMSLNSFWRHTWFLLVYHLIRFHASDYSFCAHSGSRVVQFSVIICSSMLHLLPVVVLYIFFFFLKFLRLKFCFLQEPDCNFIIKGFWRFVFVFCMILSLGGGGFLCLVILSLTIFCVILGAIFCSLDDSAF